MKLILIALISVVGILMLVGLGAAISAPFMYAGWNWGLVPALGVHEIGFLQAFWLSLGFGVIGSKFHGTNAKVES
jgi:hypothetical protein